MFVDSIGMSRILVVQNEHIHLYKLTFCCTRPVRWAGEGSFGFGKYNERKWTIKWLIDELAMPQFQA